MTRVLQTWEYFRAGGPFLGVLVGLGVALGTCLVLRGFVLLQKPDEEPFPDSALGRMLVDRRAAQLRAFRRTTRTLTAIAPLLGLLGTVSGMIQTFSALGGANASTEIAAGISEALITTELGLAIGLPGLGLGLWLERLELRVRRRMAAGSSPAAKVEP
ncbi:MAG TPA: MotA/TolQ/ExbB proton channel family protein [Myxococcales bacterium LLY-WYZ-16_1]|nr:MotA/TolQ/ExbB proton channel family protein [Myxococcales bacterium LLY-WYZ-16_1]